MAADNYLRKINNMKIKSVILASTLSVGVVNLASAVQYVYLSGSTAARNAAYAALNSTNVFESTPTFYGFGNATAAKCTWMIFSNTIATVPTVVKATWSGSEAGIQDVSTTTQEPFLNDLGVGGVPDPGPGNNVANSSTPSGAQLITNGVDLAMSDTSTASSKNPHSTAIGAKVCIIPFAFVKEKGSKAGITNITDEQFRVALSGGAKVALLTGNSNDTSYVYITGRDDGSGTRVVCFGVTGFGITKAPSQVELNSGGNMLDPEGDGSYVTPQGYASGGTVATQMGYDCSATTDQINGGTGISVIGYLGRSDANSAIANGGTEISYNGVFESRTNVIEGQFNYWGNEYIYKRSGASSQAQTVWSKMTNAIPVNVDGATTIKITDMHASRNGPTSDPVHN